MSMTKEENKFTNVALISFLLAWVLSSVLVFAAGGAQLRNIAHEPWRSQLAVFNDILCFSSMMMVAAGGVCRIVRNVRLRHTNTCVVYVSITIAALLWLTSDVLGFLCEGIRPYDSVTRTLALFGQMLFGCVLFSRYQFVEDKSGTSSDIGFSRTLALVAACLLILIFKVEMDTSSHSPVAAKSNPQPVEARGTPYDEIAKAFVSVCTGNPSQLGGSGVFIGKVENGRRIVAMMTAAHVVMDNVKASVTNELVVIPFRGYGKPDVTAKLRDVGSSWAPFKENSDIAIVDVTPYFDGLIRQGWDVRYIPMSSLPADYKDKYAVDGTCMIPSTYFERYGIGLGTPVSVLGSAIELWTPPFSGIRQPMAIRSGKIAVRPDFLKGIEQVQSPFIIIECSLIGGYSGGPVFADVLKGGRSYPILIGVATGMINRTHLGAEKTPVGTNHSGFSYITPLDEFLTPAGRQ